MEYKINYRKLSKDDLILLCADAKRELDRRKREEEATLLRANLLGGMDSYIREVVGDEDILEYWLEEGIPDNCAQCELMEIAEDDSEFRRIVVVFNKCLIGW